MSTMVEFVVPNLSAIDGLREELRSWGDESFSLDPPRYTYRELVFTLLPVAQGTRAALPPALRATDQCLELDEKVVLAWMRGALTQASERALRALAQAASAAGGQWAAVYDPGEGPISSTEVNCSEVIERLMIAVARTGPSNGAQVLIVQ